MASKQKADELRLQGNDCCKAGNHSEALLHYSHALQCDPNNHLLFSNRSFVLLKLKQYYMAYEDAKEVIRLQPKWPKGFFRKGEVEFHTGHFASALISYGQALLLDPTNEEVRAAVKKTNEELLKLKKETARQPWMFCGSGSFLGLCVVMADQYLSKQPSIQHVVLQCLLVLVFGLLGYLVLYGYRYIKESEKMSLLEQPVDLLQEMGTKDSSSEDSQKSEKQNGTARPVHRKGGASAARQRYKKGKT